MKLPQLWMTRRRFLQATGAAGAAAGAGATGATSADDDEVVDAEIVDE